MNSSDRETCTEKPSASEDVMNIIACEARAVAASFGAGDATSEAQAAALVDRLLLRLGGGQWYMPKTAALQRRKTRDWVRQNWRGDNLRELSKAAGLSPRRIRQIVQE